MKRSLLIISAIILLTPVYGQRSIDALFSKYSGKEGFVSVSVSGDLLKLSSCFSSENEEDRSLPSNITEIRILAQENKNIKSVDFFDTVIDRIDLDEYEEFMRVSRCDQELRMLVRPEGNSFREFLLIAGGDENALIQIKGKMTFSEARKLSKDLKKNNSLNF
jgi:hypothetical protein